MDKRKENILSAIIKEYVDTASPVGSSVIAEKYKFDLSSATIRNEMKSLEEEGYIYQPHTSAGRVPTDKGYRYFISSLMKKKDLPSRQQKIVKEAIFKFRLEDNQLTRKLAKLLGEMSHSLALSGFIETEEIWDWGMSELLREPEFQEIEKVYHLTSCLEKFDRYLDKVYKRINYSSVKVYIGKENPIKELPECSMLLSGFTICQGKKGKQQKGFLAIIGPKRMKYARNISLIDYVSKLFSSSSLILVLILTKLFY